MGADRDGKMAGKGPADSNRPLTEADVPSLSEFDGHMVGLSDWIVEQAGSLNICPPVGDQIV